MQHSMKSDRQQVATTENPSQVARKDEARICVDKAGLRYGERQVLQNVDFDVGKQESVTVIGPSGCGKTTLLRCIAGLLPLSEGNIFIEGQPMQRPRAGVAMVFQHFGLFPWKSVYQNVAYGLRMAKADKAETQERVQYYINMVGLAGFENAYPHQLSGGMQQRCGLARALALEPNVILMDEPFASVDAQTKDTLQFEMLRIWETKPTTMVYVTHAIEEAVLMAHRVVVLNGRPSKVSQIIDIDLPWPRNRETLLIPRFAELREYLWSLLKPTQQSNGSPVHLESVAGNRE